MIDVLFDCLINVMIKNHYEVLSIDQLIALKHEFKKDPLEGGKSLEYSQFKRLKN